MLAKIKAITTISGQTYRIGELLPDGQLCTMILDDTCSYSDHTDYEYVVHSENGKHTILINIPCTVEILQEEPDVL